MQTLAARIEAEHPDINTGWTIRLSPLADEIARTSRLELLLVFGAMFCLLLLLCANVASLAVARGVARAREIAIRLALGARGSRVTRQLIAESVLSAIVDDGHRPRADGVVGGRRAVDCAGRHSAHARSGFERARRVVRCRARSLGHGDRQRRADVSRQPHTDCRCAQRRRRRFGARIRPAARGTGRGRNCGRRDVAGRRRAVGPDVCGVAARGCGVRYRATCSSCGSHPMRRDIAPARRPPIITAACSTSLREVPAIQSVAAVTSLPMSAIGSEFTRPYWREHAAPKASGAGGRHSDGDARILRHVGPSGDGRTRVHGSRQCRRAARRDRQPEACERHVG